MDTDGLDLIVEDIYEDTPPQSWDEGFSEDSGYKLMKGENPFKIQGQWFLYVWDKEEKDIAVYSFSGDRGIDYNEFHEWLDSVKTPSEKYIRGI